MIDVLQSTNNLPAYYNPDTSCICAVLTCGPFRERIIKNLINNSYTNPTTLTIPENILIVQRYQELFNSIIPIHTVRPKKLEIPVIPKLEIEKTDSNEIKKMIRKLNIETQSFTCNHLAFDRKYDSFESDIVKVYLMQEMKNFRNIIDDFVIEINKVEKKDKMNKAWYVYRSISDYDIMKVNENIIAINSKLIEIESFFKSLKCHKCEHIVKKYQIVKETIEEMRRELKEERELTESLNDVTGEDKYSIDLFMKKHYPTIERVLLKDVCKRYEEVTGIHKTLAQMKDELNSLDYKVSNVSHKYYVTKK